MKEKGTAKAGWLGKERERERFDTVSPYSWYRIVFALFF